MLGDGLLGFKKPPAGYVCHRCKMPGTFKVVCLDIFLLYGFTFLHVLKPNLFVLLHFLHQDISFSIVLRMVTPSLI